MNDDVISEALQQFYDDIEAVKVDCVGMNKSDLETVKEDLSHFINLLDCWIVEAKE